MIERLIPLGERDAWHAALLGVPHAFAHTWESCQATALTTGEDAFLWVLDDGEARIVCPLLERRWGEHVDVVTPYTFAGFVDSGAVAGAGEAWLGFAERRGYVCGYLALHPLLSPRSEIGQGEAHRTVYALDLTRDPDELRRRLDANRRRELRPGWESVLVHDRDALSAFLLEEHPRFVDRLGASDRHRLSGATLEAMVGSRGVELVGARGPRGLESVAAFAATAWTADYLLAARKEGCAPRTGALVWWAVETFRARGVPALHLGGGVTEGDGVARAKERFGPLRLTTRVLRQVYRPELFERLCRGAGRGGYFPPYRAETHAP